MAKIKLKPKKNIKTFAKKQKAQKLLANKQYQPALELYLQVAKLDPRDADALYLSGVIFGMLGQKKSSIEQLQKAVKLRPNHVSSHYNLGISLRDCGRFEDAVKAFKATIKLKPDYRDGYNALSHALMSLKRIDEAVEVTNKLLSLDPNSAETRSNLGSFLQAQGKLTEAISQYRGALKLNHNLTTTWDSLGSALTSCGQYEEAIQAYRESLRVDPANARGHTNLLLTLNYLENLTPAQVFEEHKEWWQQHKPKAVNQPPVFDANPDRPLRIGYISPDLREHSVAYFIEPLLEAHDTDTYATWCYSSVPRADNTTERLKTMASHWRDISNQPPERVAEQIRQDKIDILVDLSGHTANNHLAIFMLRPAPIQVTWLGYPNTTGMEVMDYRLVDAITDPVDSGQYCSEKLVRLPGCFLCFKPLQTAPDIGPLPHDQNGFITFGSFNNLAKLSPTVIQLWADILKRLPSARLLLKTIALTDEKTSHRVLKNFIDAGADPDQIELLGHTESRQAHLELYNRLDIALDTFPYNGTTTSCEALWMGVPVIALCGDRHAARVSASLLENSGLSELAAEKKDDYINIACDLAKQPDRLRDLRQGMRQRLLGSTLCDRQHFAANIEQAYREMWQKNVPPPKNKVRSPGPL